MVNGGTTSYCSNSLNQYTAVGPQGSQSSYHYDKNGNLTNDGTYLYYYDCENRLTEVNDINDSPVACYKYGYLGRRVSKTVGATTTKYCYDGDQVIAEYDGNGTLLRKFIYGPGIDEPICMIDVADSNTVYYYHFDGLGSVVALSDVNGVIVEEYSYDVFGEPNRASDVNNPYMFTGRRYDNESGLYYYRARYYAPAIGRFLQTDPIGYDDGLNLYTYVGNNPVSFIDPYGFCKENIEELEWDRFREIMKPLIRDIITNRPRLGGWNPFNYYRSADSDFHHYHSNNKFRFRGRVATGEELNYYTQGILQAHYRIPPYNVYALPFLHNVASYGHLPTINEYYYTKLGRQEYNYWHSRLKD